MMRACVVVWLDGVVVRVGMTKWLRSDGSDGLVLDGFLGVDDAFLVEDAVAAVGALDGVVGLELGLLAALCIGEDLLLLPHT